MNIHCKPKLSVLALSMALICQAGVALAVDDVQDADNNHQQGKTRTPIEHVIVIIGENHTFDNVFGGYRPRQGQTIKNLLSAGIINADGTPGPNFANAAQQQASDLHRYHLNPRQTGPYASLPQPQTTYAFGQPPYTADERFPANLPNGPFQITKYVPYNSPDAYTGDPTHRFFQMWQQTNKAKMDLFVWVDRTVGIGPQNTPPPPAPGTPTAANSYQGSEAMGFFNMTAGDEPVFKALADQYAISDNYHQPIMGGTGANFLSMVTADVAFHDQNGTPDLPPANQIENPNAQPGTNNFYTQDGYAGGSYVDCADSQQPGVAPIMNYIRAQPGKTFNNGNCAPNTYYLLNNYNLGYSASGTPKPLGPNNYTLPPQTIPTIADALSAKNVSWKWYSGGRNNGIVTTPYEYCGICDPLTGFTSIMTTSLKNNLQDVTRFYQDVASNATLPAVSFIRPPETSAGHPADSTMPAFEAFVNDIVNRVKSVKQVWAKTVILITTDEGGGYYDTGYIQPIDFFGDGTRISLIAVSPYAKKGHVDHVYSDHNSILKFIEANWGLHPLSSRSRDNLPDPVANAANPYVPLNRPAIGDLMGMFDFSHAQDN